MVPLFPSTVFPGTILLRALGLVRRLTATTVRASQSNPVLTGAGINRFHLGPAGAGVVHNVAQGRVNRLGVGWGTLNLPDLVGVNVRHYFSPPLVMI